jgi:hypothetical protein
MFIDDLTIAITAAKAQQRGLVSLISYDPDTGAIQKKGGGEKNG